MVHLLQEAALLVVSYTVQTKALHGQHLHRLQEVGTLPLFYLMVLFLYVVMVPYSVQTMVLHGQSLYLLEETGIPLLFYLTVHLLLLMATELLTQS